MKISTTNYQKNLWIKDPIHGFIEFHHERDRLFLDLIDSQEMQRLRRIRQLGTLEYIYPGAEHSRFTHVLGTYATAKSMLKHFWERGLFSQNDVRETLEIPVLAAALLHDIGHGPFSHNFEMITGISHEAFSIAIIQGPSRIHDILHAYDSKLPAKVVDLLTHRFFWPVGNAIISSQLDADRLDYIVRDSYMTGANYGFLDLQRIISVLTIVEDQLAVLEKGLATIEEYLLARFYMYWDVYFHKTSRGMLILLERIFTRARQTAAHSKDFQKSDFLSNRFSFLFEAIHADNLTAILPRFLDLDETDVYMLLKIFTAGEDPVLADLSRRFLYRNLFKPIPVTDQNIIENLRQELTEQGFDPEYYLLEDSAHRKIYTPNPIESSDDQGIKIFIPQEEQLKDLSEVSVIIGQLSNVDYNRKRYIYVPAEIRSHYLPLT